MVTNILRKSEGTAEVKRAFILRKFLFFLLLCFCFSFAGLTYSDTDPCSSLEKDDKDDCEKAQKEIDDIKNSDSKCQTGLSKLFTSDGSKYSCVPNRMGLVGSLLKLDALILGRTYLNMQEVTSGQNGEQAKRSLGFNNCDEDKKSDYRESKTQITFGVCEDSIILNILKLIPIGAIVDSIVEGKDPMVVIKESISGESPYMVYTKTVGETGTLGSLGEGSYKIELIGDKICVSIKSLIFGYVPIGCKYTKEPCPNSKYLGFFDEDTTKKPCTFVTTKNDEASKIDVKNTQKKFGSCYIEAQKNSKNIIQITSPLAHCIKANLASILTGSPESYDISNPSVSEDQSPVFRLQKSMKRFITGLFVLYVMFFGIKIALGRVEASKELIISMVKFIFVVYFSVGFNYSGKNSGITEYLFPFIIEGSTYFASWISSDSQGGGLCSFSREEYKNIDLSLFDSMDCRISHYFGINDIYLVFKIGSAGQIAGQIAKSGVLFVIIGVCIYLGFITIVMVIITYFILILMIFINFLQAFVMSLICSTILAILAPIVVPLYLFERTKQYFDSWLSMLISFTLQPMVITTFFVIFSKVFDYGYYGNCQFKGINLEQDKDGSTVKIFLLDKNPALYQDQDSCTLSIGYLLSPAFDLGAISKIKDKYTVEDFKNLIKKSDDDKQFLTKKEGIFTSYNTLNNIGEVITRLLKSIFVLYICYGVSSNVTGFAADMTGGVNLSSAVSSVNKGLGSIEKSAKKFGKKRKSERNAKDKRGGIKSSEKKDDKDSVSVGDKGGKDSVSVGDKGGKEDDKKNDQNNQANDPGNDQVSSNKKDE